MTMASPKNFIHKVMMAGAQIIQLLVLRGLISYSVVNPVPYFELSQLGTVHTEKFNPLCLLASAPFSVLD